MSELNRAKLYHLHPKILESSVTLSYAKIAFLKPRGLLLDLAILAQNWPLHDCILDLTVEVILMRRKRSK